jgi:hypothetical protein
MTMDVIIFDRAAGNEMAGAVLSVVSGSLVLPTPGAPDCDALRRFVNFFTGDVRNPSTRGAYARADNQCAGSCEAGDLRELQEIESVHVAPARRSCNTGFRRRQPPDPISELAAFPTIACSVSR